MSFNYKLAAVYFILAQFETFQAINGSGFGICKTQNINYAFIVHNHAYNDATLIIHTFLTQYAHAKDGYDDSADGEDHIIHGQCCCHRSNYGEHY